MKGADNLILMIAQQSTYLTAVPCRTRRWIVMDTMVLHSSLLVAISAHLFMFIPAYRETFPSHPHLFLPRPRLPFTMPSVIIRCRLSCLLTMNLTILCRTTVVNLVDCSPSLFSTSLLVFFAFHETLLILLYIHISEPLGFISFCLR